MGNVLLSLGAEDEALLRRLAREKFEGKKGALSEVVSEAVHELARKDARMKSAKSLIEKARRGFDLGLGKRKVYESRDELYG